MVTHLPPSPLPPPLHTSRMTATVLAMVTTCTRQQHI
jgi:hypothetical protein